jgi:hypothetical protein
LLPLVERNPSICLTRKFGSGADIGGGRPLEDQTRRRDLIAFVGAASTLASFAAAQQPKCRPSALLFAGSSGSEHFWQLLQQDMYELRHTEGRNVRYEFRSDAGQKNRLPSSAEELVQLKVDLDLIRFKRARP